MPLKQGTSQRDVSANIAIDLDTARENGAKIQNKRKALSPPHVSCGTLKKRLAGGSCGCSACEDGHS